MDSSILVILMSLIESAKPSGSNDCNSYKIFSRCERKGCVWQDGACTSSHTTPPTTPSTPSEGEGWGSWEWVLGTLIVTVFILTLLTFLRKKIRRFAETLMDQIIRMRRQPLEDSLPLEEITE